MLGVAKIVKAKVLKLLAKIKFQLITLWYAFKDPECPIYIRATVFIVICYGFSPIDLIPDFIPILGYLDELVIFPIFIGIVDALMPSNIMIRAKAQALTHLENKQSKPKVWIGILIIVSIWVLAATLLAPLLMPMLQE